jgi:glucosamine-phosphate N-acetyltransferase
MEIYFRKLEINDYNNGYIELLRQLTEVSKNNISEINWINFVNNLSDSHQIIILCDKQNNKIIGSGTLLIENKIIHNMGKVAHIEDIVIDSTIRGQGLGKKMIDYLITKAKELQVYKIILNCADHNILFYEKCGFTIKGNQMAIYCNNF